MNRNSAAARFVYSTIFVVLLSGAAGASAQSGPDWSTVPPVTISTTDGPTTETFALQVAKVGDQVYFRVQFNYSGASRPGEVFFAVELGRHMNVTMPMSQGDEMIIASQEGPDGKTPSTYDYYLSDTESQPDPIVPGSVTVHTIRISNSQYEMVFSRPMITNDTARQVQLEAGKPVILAFAVSEWGLESSHAYTQFSYQMNITQSQVTVSAYERQGGGGQVLATEEMMINPEQAVIEATSIFLVLFVGILYLGTGGQRKA